jgi:MoaA/NifB/PqqE/SkfB family radical SAM enzyme
MAEEWKASKKWNPFNSAKLLAHVDRWELIKEGHSIPAPVLVTIDPTNKCNLNCSWCNAKAVRKNAQISTAMLERIAEFLGEWGVTAVCLAGGGEPMIHSGFDDLVGTLVDTSIRVGVVTNGTHLDRLTTVLCDWIGISVDAGHWQSYKANKGCDRYSEVKRNIRRLVRFTDRDHPLAKPGLGNGVFWKFLVHPTNVGEMYSAAKQAKDIGCKGIHFRPAGTPWNQLQHDKIEFKRKHLKTFNNQLAQSVAQLDDDKFSVYGVKHKFTKDLRAKHAFKKCHAVFMTCVFMPSTDGNPEHFDVGLCCDRRGDSSLTIRNLQRPEQLLTFWGSTEHWDMAKKIDLHKECPRCTYAPHNEIFEAVIERDDMTHVFI